MDRCSLDRGWLRLAGFWALAALALSPVDKASAAAWTRAQNQYLLVIPVEYSTADRQFDENGDKVDRLRFQQAQISPYFEFGLTDTLTIGAQPRFIWVRQANAMGGDDNNSGLADVDVFARYRLWGRDSAALSAQALVRAPIEADETEVAPLGFDQADIEGSLLYANAYPAGSGRIFYNVDVGYRKRFETPGDEIHGNGFIGWPPNDSRWTFVVASNNTFGVKNEDDNLFEALTARPDFRRNQVQGSASYRLGDRVSIVAGGFTTVSGRNVGVSHGGFISLVFSLDPSLIFGSDPYF